MMNRKTKRLFAIVALAVIIAFILGMVIDPIIQSRADDLSGTNQVLELESRYE